VPEVVDSKSVNLGSTPALYGLFASPHAAATKLRALADQHSLCLSVLGLEPAGQRGCFGVQIKTCLGVCVGQEDRAIHDARLFSALCDSQVEVWPFAGAVDVVETAGTWVQRHRVNNWCYLGTQCSRSLSSLALNDAAPREFDLDSYKILVRPIMLKTAVVEPVAS
jgi:excinuclease Cho